MKTDKDFPTNLTNPESVRRWKVIRRIVHLTKLLPKELKRSTIEDIIEKTAEEEESSMSFREISSLFAKALIDDTEEVS